MGRWDRRNFGKAGGFMENDCEDEEGKEDVTHMYYTIKCTSSTARGGAGSFKKVKYI